MSELADILGHTAQELQTIPFEHWLVLGIAVAIGLMVAAARNAHEAAEARRAQSRERRTALMFRR